MIGYGYGGYGYGGYGYGYPPPYYWDPAYHEYRAKMVAKSSELNQQIANSASVFTGTVNGLHLNQHYAQDGRKLEKVLQQVHDYLRFRGRAFGYNHYIKESVVDTFDTLSAMMIGQQSAQTPLKIFNIIKPKRDLAVSLVVMGIGLGLLGFSLGAMLSMVSIGLAIAGFFALFFVAPLLIVGTVMITRAALSMHFERNITQVRHYVQNPQNLNTPQPRQPRASRQPGQGRFFRMSNSNRPASSQPAQQQPVRRLPRGYHPLVSP